MTEEERQRLEEEYGTHWPRLAAAVGICVAIMIVLGFVL